MTLRLRCLRRGFGLELGLGSVFKARVRVKLRVRFGSKLGLGWGFQSRVRGKLRVRSGMG